MGYASKAGRAHASARNPIAFAVCDRCGMWYNRTDLVWQFDWSGSALVNQRVYVCTRTCLDKPQPQLKARFLTADPLPIQNPRPENFAAEEDAPNDFNIDFNNDFGPL